MKHRYLADWPAFHVSGGRARIAEIDNLGTKRRAVLIEGDQHLVAEGGEGMDIEGKRHGEHTRWFPDFETTMPHMAGGARDGFQERESVLLQQPGRAP
jgi:hypothetical protein